MGFDLPPVVVFYSNFIAIALKCGAMEPLKQTVKGQNSVAV